ncbi:hypothetical protein [uncultured Desulfosarcina sp.]|uniref:hypothetical protein n=1 Tax=uncultured Desulfosarcina sp. TaxID=218289 RepID=UPI0029C99492|nr:hypothetical protein [uncultured Desulfosarcina sp.]
MEHNSQAKKDRDFFLFRFLEPIPGKSENRTACYDNDRQIWVDKQTNLPLVETFNKQKFSNYGETIMTETKEGVDQSEVLSSSDFGETISTATNEGIDQREIVNQDSSTDFGETIMTKTSEGIDQREIF